MSTASAVLAVELSDLANLADDSVLVELALIANDLAIAIHQRIEQRARKGAA